MIDGQFTQEEAIRFHDSGAWKSMTPAIRGKLQLYQDLLCMPFDAFHEGIEAALGRSVFTHEFAYRELLKIELCGDAPAPTMTDIINLIPVDKRIIIEVPNE